MRRPVLAALGAATAVVAVALAVVLTNDDGVEPASAASQATGTTTIRRRDLVETETVDGTLGYADSRTVVSRIAGTVTWMPEAGTVIDTNHRLYEVDGSGVYLLDGTYPAYRALGDGLTGRDVRQFERNLRALGLDPGHAMRVDGTWDAGTTAATKRWQRRKGLDPTGSVEFGRIVFAPGTRRVGAVEVGAGADASGQTTGVAAGQSGASSALMTTTSTRRLVTVDLEATKQALADAGDEVSLELPGGDDIKGTIASVGTVAEKQVTAADDDPPATLKVEIRLDGSAGGLLDQAPVDVRLEKQRAEDVLTVAVTALLARQGGTFAVEVRDGGRRRVVPVTTGLYTDSAVEIRGAGLRAGMTITNAGV